MKMKVFISGLVLSSLFLTGCSSGVKQVQKEIQAGESYDLLYLLQPKDENAKVSVVEDNIDIKKLGTYNVKVKIDSNGSSTEKMFKFKVIDTRSPILEMIHSSTYDIDEKFDIKSDIKAVDNLDGDLIDKIEVVSNNVDTSKEGEYKISVKVKDSLGNESIEEFNITVKDVLSKYDEATIKALNALKSILKNPNSLQLNKVEVSNPDYSMWGLKIDYSAENGFGGSNREDLYFNFSDTDSELSQTDFTDILQEVYKGMFDANNVKELDVKKIMRNIDK